MTAETPEQRKVKLVRQGKVLGFSLLLLGGTVLVGTSMKTVIVYSSWLMQGEPVPIADFLPWAFLSGFVGAMLLTWAGSRLLELFTSSTQGKDKDKEPDDA